MSCVGSKLAIALRRRHLLEVSASLPGSVTPKAAGPDHGRCTAVCMMPRRESERSSRTVGAYHTVDRACSVRTSGLRLLRRF